LHGTRSTARARTLARIGRSACSRIRHAPAPAVPYLLRAARRRRGRRSGRAAESASPARKRRRWRCQPEPCPEKVSGSSGLPRRPRRGVNVDLPVALPDESRPVAEVSARARSTHVQARARSWRCHASRARGSSRPGASSRSRHSSHRADRRASRFRARVQRLDAARPRPGSEPASNCRRGRLLRRRVAGSTCAPAGRPEDESAQRSRRRLPSREASTRPLAHTGSGGGLMICRRARRCNSA
jgi:hypothetical protein